MLVGRKKEINTSYETGFILNMAQNCIRITFTFSIRLYNLILHLCHSPFSKDS